MGKNGEGKEVVWCVSGDFHCGATTGVTPEPNNQIQRDLLERYEDGVKWVGPHDVSLFMGDGTDGEDPKGKDVDEHDIFTQAERCAELLAMQKPRKEYIIITGTRYHTGRHGDMFEKHIKKCLESIELRKRFGVSDEVKVSIKRKLRTTVNGWFRLVARHKIGGSVIPHGRATAPMRFKMWESLRASLYAMQTDQKARWPHLCLFGHRHYDLYVEDAFGAAAIVQCFQAEGSRYGDEECEGVINVGIHKLTVSEKEHAEWRLQKKTYPLVAGQLWESR